MRGAWKRELMRMAAAAAVDDGVRMLSILNGALEAALSGGAPMEPKYILSWSGDEAAR